MGSATTTVETRARLAGVGLSQVRMLRGQSLGARRPEMALCQELTTSGPRGVTGFLFSLSNAVSPQTCALLLIIRMLAAMLSSPHATDVA